MRSRHHLATLLLITLHVSASAQVYIDQRMELQATNPQDRQVVGLPSSTESDELLSTEVEQSGVHRYAVATSGQTWSVELPSLVGSPQLGTHVLVVSPESQGGPLSLSINGTGPYPITRYGSLTVLGEGIQAGELLSLVFDGNGFQLMNGSVHERLQCPPDMAAASTEFCIDTVEHAATDFYTAALTCVQEGKRLCSWGEFYSACNIGPELGITDLVGNGEWSNSTANYDGVVRVVGGGCATAGAGAADVTPRVYHCCMSR